MELLVAFGLFVTIAVALFALGTAWVLPASVLGLRLRTALGLAVPLKEEDESGRRLEQVLEPISRAVPKSPSEVSRTRALLMQAGHRELRHLTIYFGLRGLLAALFAGAAILSGLALRSPLLVVGAALFGYILPRFLLKRMVKLRQRVIQLSLPDALDLTIICMEAGLGLDQALKRVGEELRYAHPQLSDELGLVNLEMRAGKPRTEALRNLVARTGVNDIRALVAVLVQTDRFGTSVAQALRVHSDALRTERRQRAEEQAAKTTIKMVPVLVFFLFPAMFIVSLGPAAISLIRNLLPAVQK